MIITIITTMRAHLAAAVTNIMTIAIVVTNITTIVIAAAVTTIIMNMNMMTGKRFSPVRFFSLPV